VLGVSMDDQASHKMFAEKYGLPFVLLADSEGIITKAYDVYNERNGQGYAQRVTYIINTEGMIDYVDDKVNTESHAQDILARLG
jgi:peroxiredoxin Q/BCP